MTDTIRIPDTDTGVIERIGTVGDLISARKWERAALIAAIVGPPRGSGGHNRKQNSTLSFKYSPATFASTFQIYGLRSAQTVAYYRDQWCEHRPVPRLGEEVDLDGLPRWIGQGTSNAEKAEIRKAHAASQPVPDSLTYGTITTHPPISDNVIDYESLAAERERRRGERAEESDALRDEFGDRADRNREGGRGMRVEPDVEVRDVGPSPQETAYAELPAKLFHAKTDIREALDAMPEHWDNLDPSWRGVMWAHADELEELAGKLRQYREEYGS